MTISYERVQEELLWVSANIRRLQQVRYFFGFDWYRQRKLKKLLEKNRQLLAVTTIANEITALMMENERLGELVTSIEQEIEENKASIHAKNEQAREIFMAKRKGAVHKDGGNDVKAGLHSLLMMVVFALILVLVVVFFVLSPFGAKKAQRPSPELNKPAEVVPLSPSESETSNYNFYEVLPERKFESTESNLSEQAPDEGGTLRIDKVEKIEQSTPAEDEITIVEDSHATYDETSEPQEDEGSAEDIKIQASKIQYVLRVKSYESASEADSRRAEVMMAGVDAEVKRQEVEGGVVFTVVSTPFANKEMAKSAYDRLSASGIDSLVVEQKF